MDENSKIIIIKKMDDISHLLDFKIQKLKLEEYSGILLMKPGREFNINIKNQIKLAEQIVQILKSKGLDYSIIIANSEDDLLLLSDDKLRNIGLMRIK